MPWKECSVMDERLRFVAQLLDGEAMSEVCRAFGISRKTGYNSRACPHESGRRVQARQWPVLLSADCHRSRLALSPAL